MKNKLNPPPLNVDPAIRPTRLAPELMPVPESQIGTSIDPKLDARLSEFMKNDPKASEYYAKLVKENPDRAIRSIMLMKMLRHEDDMRLVQKRLPQVKEWLGQQSQEVQQRLEERLKNVNPIYREKALVNEAMRLKGRMDFSPKASVGAKMSMG